MKAYISALLFLLSVFPVHGDVKNQYQKYTKLSSEERQAMVRRYVRKRHGMWAVQKGIYRVYTDISPEKTLGYAIFMHDFASRISSLFKGRARGKFQPAVYITKTKEDMFKLIEKHKSESGGKVGDLAEWGHGFYVSSLQNLYAFESRGTLETLLHEGTHQFNHYLLGRNIDQLPVWLDEGLATNFETWDLKDTMENNLKKSRERSNRKYVVKKMFAMKKLPLTMEQLFKKDPWSWCGAKGEEVQYQYTLAWSYTDYLLNSRAGLAYINKILQWISRGEKKKHIPARVVDAHVRQWKKYVKEEVVPATKRPVRKRENRPKKKAG